MISPLENPKKKFMGDLKSSIVVEEAKQVEEVPEIAGDKKPNYYAVSSLNQLDNGGVKRELMRDINEITKRRTDMINGPAVHSHFSNVKIEIFKA